jgi:hypothetical protein
MKRSVLVTILPISLSVQEKPIGPITGRTSSLHLAQVLT